MEITQKVFLRILQNGQLYKKTTSTIRTKFGSTDFVRRLPGTDVHIASASIITELLEKIARLFDSTLDYLLERAMADEETRQDLERILRCNQDFKERPID